MSFRCEHCNRIVPKGEPANRVVTATRPHQHPKRSKANRDGSDDNGGAGSQIVTEKTICGSCVA